MALDINSLLIKIRNLSNEDQIDKEIATALQTTISGNNDSKATSITRNTPAITPQISPKFDRSRVIISEKKPTHERERQSFGLQREFDKEKKTTFELGYLCNPSTLVEGEQVMKEGSFLLEKNLSPEGRVLQMTRTEQQISMQSKAQPKPKETFTERLKTMNTVYQRKGGQEVGLTSAKNELPPPPLSPKRATSHELDLDLIRSIEESAKNQNTPENFTRTRQSSNKLASTAVNLNMEGETDYHNPLVAQSPITDEMLHRFAYEEDDSEKKFSADEHQILELSILTAQKEQQARRAKELKQRHETQCIIEESIKSFAQFEKQRSKAREEIEKAAINQMMDGLESTDEFTQDKMAWSLGL